MISENTNLEVMAELEFKYSNDPEQSAVDLWNDLQETDLTVVQGFGDEFAYYLVRVEETDESVSDEVLGKAEPMHINHINDRSEIIDDAHPLDPSSYSDPEVGDECGSGGDDEWQYNPRSD